MKVVWNLIRMSDRHYVKIMSVNQYVRMQPFSLGIKMKIVQNVIRMSGPNQALVSKTLEAISKDVC